MLTWPSSTAPLRPASESVRSVPGPTMRTSSAASKTSAILRIRSPSASQSSSTASKMNCSYSASVIPASCAPAMHRVLGDHPRHRHRHRAAPASACSPPAAPPRRSSESSEPSRDVLGRPDRDERVDLLPDAPLQRRRHAQQLERRLARERAADLLERELQRSDRRRRRAICSITASTSGRASGVARTKHLPAGLDADRALDEQARVLVDPWVAHDREVLPVAERAATTVRFGGGYSSVRRNSSISSAGQRLDPRRAAGAERDRDLRDRRDVRRLDDVHEVELAERRPLVQHAAAELLDVLVDLAQPLRVRLERLRRPAGSASTGG